MALWEDKRILCSFLRQPYQEIPVGEWCLKPAVNEEGLGLGAKKMLVDEPAILQPFQDGAYRNIDRTKDGEYRVWSAKRKGIFFQWFHYLGPYERLVTPAQRGAMEKLANTTYGGVINAEFIGDYCIEAHDRGSFELDATVQLWHKCDEEIFSVPVWAPTPEGFTRKHFLSPHAIILKWEPLQNETRINGKKRSGIVTISAADQEAATAFAETYSLAD